MKVILTVDENIQTYDVEVEGSEANGQITNRTQEGDFRYKPDEFEGHLTSNCLRAIADKLDELNEK